MSSQICLKLHLDSEILRVRAPVDKCQKVDDICNYVEMAWPALSEVSYRLYYIDDMDDACILSQISLPDALALAEESRVPTMNIFVDIDDEEDVVVVDDPLSRMVDELIDGDLIPSYGVGQELVRVLQDAGQDLDKVTQELAKSRSKKSGSRTTTKKNAPKSPSVAAKPKLQPQSSLKIEREVSDENEAMDTMVDLLSDLGFVDSKKAARDLMDKLVSSTDDLNKVADNIKRRVEEQQREDAYSKADECVMADKKPGEHLAQLLNDYGFVVDEDSANKLVAALEATDQDLNRILFHFIHGPSKPVNDKPLPTPEERQAMDDAAAMRGVKEEVKEYEQKQKKAGKKLQAAEPRWGWAGPKHPRDPKADKIDLLG